MKMEDPFTRRSTRPTMMTKDPYKDQEVIMSSELLRKLEDDRRQKLEEDRKKMVVLIFYLFSDDFSSKIYRVEEKVCIYAILP